MCNWASESKSCAKFKSPHGLWNDQLRFFSGDVGSLKNKNTLGFQRLSSQQVAFPFRAWLLLPLSNWNQKASSFFVLNFFLTRHAPSEGQQNVWPCQALRIWNLYTAESSCRLEEPNRPAKLPCCFFFSGWTGQGFKSRSALLRLKKSHGKWGRASSLCAAKMDTANS